MAHSCGKTFLAITEVKTCSQMVKILSLAMVKFFDYLPQGKFYVLLYNGIRLNGLNFNFKVNENFIMRSCIELVLY